MALASCYQPPLFPTEATEPTEKGCTVCGRLFLLTAFYRKRDTRDGLTTACKDCIKARVRAYQESHREQRRAYELQYQEANRELLKERRQAYYQEHLEECRARGRRSSATRWAKHKAEQAARDEAMRAPEGHKVCTACGQTLPLEAFYGKRTGKYGLTGRCKECIKGNVRSYQAQNREACIARCAAYYEANREALKAAARAYEHAHRAERYIVRKAMPVGRYTVDDVQALYIAQAGLCAYCGIALDGGFHVDHKIPLSRGGSNWPENLAVACARCNNRKHTKTDTEFLALLAGTS